MLIQSYMPVLLPGLTSCQLTPTAPCILTHIHKDQQHKKCRACIHIPNLKRPLHLQVLQARLLPHKVLPSTLQCVGKMLTDNAVATRESGKKSAFALASIEGMMDIVRRKLPKNYLEKFEKVRS